MHLHLKVRHLHSPFLIGVNGVLARWVFKKSYLWNINKLQISREISCKLSVLDEIFSIRVTESGPKSRFSLFGPILSLYATKILLVYCRLKVYKTKSKMNFWLTASTNVESTRLCHKSKSFWVFFGSGSGVFDCDWWSNFIKKGDAFCFTSLHLVFLAKQCVPLAPNNI